YSKYREQFLRDRSSSSSSTDRPVRSMAQSLPELEGRYGDIVARNERVFHSDIPANWRSNHATQRYLNDLDYYSAKWHSACATSLVMRLPLLIPVGVQQLSQRGRNWNSPGARCQTCLIASSATCPALLSLAAIPMAASLPT